MSIFLGYPLELVAWSKLQPYQGRARVLIGKDHSKEFDGFFVEFALFTTECKSAVLKVLQDFNQGGIIGHCMDEDVIINVLCIRYVCQHLENLLVK